MLEFCKQFAEDVGKLSETQINRRRHEVLKLLKEKINDIHPTIKTFDPRSLNTIFTNKMFEFLLALIDEHFFEDKLLTAFRENKCCLSACLDNRCTSVGGKCWSRGKVFTLKISTKVLTNSFDKDRIKRTVGQVECNDIIACLLLTLEHELVHAILGCNCRESARSDSKELTYGTGYNGKTDTKGGHSKTFMNLLTNRFGHETFTHKINGIRKDQIDKKTFKKEDLKKGDQVLIISRFKSSIYKMENPVHAMVEIIKLNKKNFSFKLVDKKLIKLLGMNQRFLPTYKNVSYRIISGKVESEEYPSGSAPKPTVSIPPKPKPTVSIPLAVVTKSEKPSTKPSLCTTRNPAPPCKEGYYEKLRPNGSACCYKGAPPQPKKTVAKTVAKPTKKTTYKVKKISTTPIGFNDSDGKINYDLVEKIGYTYLLDLEYVNVPKNLKEITSHIAIDYTLLVKVLNESKGLQHLKIFNNALFNLPRLNWNRDITKDFSNLLEADKLIFHKLSTSSEEKFYLLKMNDTILLANNFGDDTGIGIACVITNLPKYDLQNKVLVDTFENIWSTTAKNNTATTVKNNTTATANTKKRFTFKKKANTSAKCTKRNPAPPCEKGYVIRKRPNGAECCYIDYSKK
jgi:hypothetical protein